MVLQFDLSDIPADATVTSAIIKLEETSVYSYSGTNLTMHRILESWDEATTCWNNKPGNGPMTGRGKNSGSTYTFDVTAITQDMVRNPADNHDFLIHTDVNQTQLTFASTENGSTAGPELTVEWDGTSVSSDLKKCLKSGLLAVQKGNSVQLYLPFSGTCGITVFDLHGRKLFSEKTTVNYSWYSIQVKLCSGMYAVSLFTEGRTYRVFLNIAQ